MAIVKSCGSPPRRPRPSRSGPRRCPRTGCAAVPSTPPRDRVVAGVLVVVEEHPVGLAVRSRHQLGRHVRRRCAVPPPARRRARRGARRRSPSAARSARRRASRRLLRSSASRWRRARRAPRAATWATRRARRRERALRHRVEVDPPLIRALHVGAARIPRVKLDRGHLHCPDHVGEPRDAQLIRVAPIAGKVDAHGLHPGRCPRREALLVNLLAIDATRKAVEHARALRERAHDPFPDGEVVAREVELGLAARQNVDAVRVGDAHPSPSTSSRTAPSEPGDTRSP